MPECPIDLKDGEFLSRKFILAILSVSLLTLVTCGAVIYPAVAGVLPTFIGGLLGIVSLYFGGNITNKWVAGKTAIQWNLTTEELQDLESPKKSDKEGE
jgi:hypothetical protein